MVCVCVSDTQAHLTRQSSYHSTASQLPSAQHPDSSTGHSPSLHDDGRQMQLPTSPGNDGLPSLTSTSSTASSPVLRQSRCPALAVVKPLTLPRDHHHENHDDDDDETELKCIFSAARDSEGISQRHCGDDEEEDTNVKLI